MDPHTKLTSWLCTATMIVTVCYIAACSFWPFGNCRRCSGRGRLGSPSRRYHRTCPRCDGTGRRVRIGRRLWTYLRREYRDGNR